MYRKRREYDKLDSMEDVLLKSDKIGAKGWNKFLFKPNASHDLCISTSYFTYSSQMNFSR